MCHSIYSLLQTLVCGLQMLSRVFMTTILMIENLLRLILQTLYNFVSFVLQLLSLIPICAVFLVAARLKCFVCGGGGACPVNNRGGGACDCLMSAVAIIIMFFIFRATGVLDKIFYSLGYTKAKTLTYKFSPTPGDITECSRNDSEYTEITRMREEWSDYTEISTATYLTDEDVTISTIEGLITLPTDIVNVTEITIINTITQAEVPTAG
ncbi:uncharacterized protein LOC112046559 [Bicyclus anynana]|uniref:Uncharacterized protein LOC112046559 n=1 Tax=Bicyclus anynana TaxID=110368 RepID=A0A6J1N7L9_BICAN|nr:uncharacterized protein LOC112046559 [Bicyclus anynana]